MFSFKWAKENDFTAHFEQSPGQMALKVLILSYAEGLTSQNSILINTHPQVRPKICHDIKGF